MAAQQSSDSNRCLHSTDSFAGTQHPLELYTFLLHAGTPLLHGTAEPAVSSSSSSSRASAALAAHSSVMMNIEQGPGSPAVLSKVYWNTLPLLCLIAALCYIDRTNLAYASFSLTKDLNFSPSVYGTGSGLFFVG